MVLCSLIRTFAGDMIKLLHNWLTTLGRFIMLMGRTFSVPERFRMFWKQYVKEMAQLGVNSLYPDEAEYPESVDAPLGKWLYHA